MKMVMSIEPIVGGYHGRIKIKNSNGLSTYSVVADTRDEVIDTLLHENEEKVCETCGGSGEVSFMQEVHVGEPQTMARVGMTLCPDCQGEDSRDRSDE